MDGNTEITSAAGQRSINVWEFPYISSYLYYGRRGNLFPVSTLVAFQKRVIYQMPKAVPVTVLTAMIPSIGIGNFIISFTKFDYPVFPVVFLFHQLYQQEGAETQVRENCSDKAECAEFLPL